MYVAWVFVFFSVAVEGVGGVILMNIAEKGSYSTAENSKTLISAVDICIRRYEAQLQLQSLT